ncbi:MAG TPA: hypothetical protein ENJ12_04195 [Thiolapillus brandeum]|uniref:DUF4412 domain-containing protein n=1 Tax=Thiolapillus brandeum TaxID=1076588 RepID=A0A831RXP4_9GAMM|nr:hypothetical protein [Thiolapillus brandeum]
MRQIVTVFLLLTSTALMAGEAELLVYQVKEPGVDNYVSRILVNERYLRLDEGGEPDAGYTIYDRQEKKIFNVDPLEKTVLEMNPPAFQPAPPADLDLEEQVTTDPDSPAVAGQQPVKIKLQANGETCRELVVIKNPLPGAVSAMKELYQALARLQYPAVGSPGYTENSCELSEYVYAPQRAFLHGLPLWDVMGGKQRMLVDFKDAFEVPDDTFAVPDDFERVTPSAWQ